MTRSKSIVRFVAVIVFCVPVIGQHHETSQQAAPPGLTSLPLSSATVTFGSFMSLPKTCSAPPCPTLNRFVTGGNTTAYNHHALTPEVAKISVGGTVNFIISGFHVVAIYDDGIVPSNIDTSVIVGPSVPGGPPRAIPIINYDSPEHRRIYFGLDPALLPAGGLRTDRVETFRFDKPGLYLVICAVVSHFDDGMYGYVRVLPSDETLTEGTE